MNKTVLITCLTLLLSCLAGGAIAQRKNPRKAEAPDNKGENVIEQLQESERNSAEYLFVEGMEFFVRDDYRQAIKSFEKSRQVNPLPAVNYQIARAHLQLEQYREAMVYAREALQKEPRNKYYHLLLAEIYERQDDYARAQQVYEQMLLRFEGVDHYYDLANALVAQEKWKEAIAVYDKIEQKSGVEAAVLERKKNLYLAMRNTEGALKEGQKLIDIFPDEANHYMAQAELLLRSKRTSEAQKLVDKMRARFPDEAKTQLIQAEIFQMEGNKAGQYSEIESAFANKDLSLEARVQMLMQFFESMKTPEARTIGLKLATLTVEHYPASPHAQGIYGAFLQDAGQLKEARNAYLQAVEELNDNFRLWSNIIKIDIELQDFGAMAKHSDQALEYFPNHTLFWFYNGMSNLALRKYEEAIEALEQAKSLSYGDEELQFNIHAQLGDAYNGIRDYNKSDAAYEHALSLQPDNTHVLNNYSYYLSLRKEKLDKAREMSAKIIAKEPNNATYLDTHAWVLYVQGKYKEALLYIEKAIATGTSSGTILEHYGDILFKLGRKEEAVIQWEKARNSGGIDIEQISRKIAEKKLAE